MSATLKDDIEKCIRSCIEKFQKWPNNFFTESDAHSYLYYYFFRFGSKELKISYPTKDPKVKTVLLHREYPTTFRYHRKKMQLDENRGGRGRYDLAVLNPSFIAAHTLDEVIAKDHKKSSQDTEQLLAAIEFKLITKPLGKDMKDEVEKDFLKLTWALESRQTDNVYLIIFNKARKEEDYWEELKGLKKQYPEVKGVYLESVVGINKKDYSLIYLNERDWRYIIRFK